METATLQRIESALADNTTKTNEMHEIFEPARNFFLFLAAIGNFGLRVLEGLAKIARPLLWILGFAVALWGFFQTGHWAIPSWVNWGK